MVDIDRQWTDVLVLGAGIAGYRAAAAAVNLGAKVTLVSRSKGASPYVIGFNAPIGGKDNHDTPQAYYEDMVKGGYGLNDTRLVAQLANHAAQGFTDLSDIHVPFSKIGPIPKLRHLSGNRHPRSVFVPGGTGKSVLNALSNEVQRSAATVLSGYKVLDLIRAGEQVIGAVVWKIHSNTLTFIYSRATVLATGGLGQAFGDTTYPADVSGQSFGLAYRAGATLIDMEFIQFEPVVTVWPVACKGMEMPTAMLGDGARIRNALGERFLVTEQNPKGEKGIEKARMALLIQNEINEGRGLPQGGVTFDTTVLPKETLESYVSHCKRLRSAGIDPCVTAPIVAPAAHSIMGGVAIDDHCWSGVPGLYVAGEAAGGVHGASRIAGNGCADAIVFGDIAGRTAAGNLLASPPSKTDFIEREHLNRLFNINLLHRNDEVTALKTEAQQALTMAAGIYRQEDQLLHGLQTVNQIQSRIGPSSEAGLRSMIDLLELSNILLASSCVIHAALLRKESRGAHQRLDYKSQDDENWLKHIGFYQDADSVLSHKLLPVQ